MDRSGVERYRLSLFGRMVMGVAHEVDNHLSVVIGFSELLHMTAGNEQKVRDGASKVLSAGEKIGTIVKHFSQYVRPHVPAPEAFPPEELISEILLFSRYDLGRGGVVVAAPKCWPKGLMQGDRRDVGLALLALLFNGAEAMRGTGGDLTLDAVRRDADWVVSISDRGPGVPAGAAEAIFEEGFTTRTEPFRTGMGLPVARHLIAEAGGTLELTNALAGGCVATVRLPALGAR
jgi:C4-dicarboxylate-specific signal transduction histidine kinase